MNTASKLARLTPNAPAGVPRSEAAPAGTRPAGGRNNTIDFWRGLACLAVVLFHSLGAFSEEVLWAPLEVVRAIAMKGWLGLHLFFVISGYCIFERLRSAHRGRETPSAFALDRARRIFPTYWAVLAVAVAIGLLAMPFNGTSLDANLPSSPGRWLSNLALLHPFFGYEPFIVVTWTLSCELAFYAIATVLLALTRRAPDLRWALAAGALLCAVSLGMQTAHPALLPLALWPEFFAGACVSLALHSANSIPLRVAALALLIASSMATVLGLGSFDAEARRWAVGFAWVLLASARWSSAAMTWWPLDQVTRIGAFSYSLYLLHVPLLSRFMNLASRHLAPDTPAFAACWVGAVMLALGGGWLCWRWVEQPFERRRQSRRTQTGMTGGAHPA